MKTMAKNSTCGDRRMTKEEIKMKEITGKDWAKNYKPRKMWCWDYDENKGVQKKVIYVSEKNIEYPIIAISDTDKCILRYKHCAECKEK